VSGFSRTGIASDGRVCYGKPAFFFSALKCRAGPVLWTRHCLVPDAPAGPCDLRRLDSIAAQPRASAETVVVSFAHRDARQGVHMEQAL